MPTVDEALENALLEMMVACDRARMYHYPKELQERLDLVKRATANVRKQVLEYKGR